MGSAVGQLLSVARAQEAAQAQQDKAGGFCLSMIFEGGAKVKFDTEKYVQNHLPLLRDVYGDSVERIEVRAAPEPEPGALILSVAMFAGIPAPRAATTLWIKDVAAFGQKLAANADRINKDLDAVSYGNRLVQLNRVVLGLGDARGAIVTDTPVFSIYFRQFVPITGDVRGPGAAVIKERAANAVSAPPFDARLFTEVYVPRLFSAYGSNAVHRAEATVGMEQGGQKPAQHAAFHLFIRDRAAYDQESPNAFLPLKEEMAKFSQSAVAVFSDMRVKGIA